MLRADGLKSSDLFPDFKKALRGHYKTIHMLQGMKM
jgi:hypothetical protein